MFKRIINDFFWRYSRLRRAAVTDNGDMDSEKNRIDWKVQWYYIC